MPVQIMFVRDKYAFGLFTYSSKCTYSNTLKILEVNKYLVSLSETVITISFI